MSRPDLSRVPSFYHKYIDKVAQDELLAALGYHQAGLVAFLETLSPVKWDYRYAEGKWSVKEVVQHIIDAERIFTYRSLSFARLDKTPLPGFEENDYAAASEADRREPANLLSELKAVQASTISLFESFSPTQLQAVGTANGNPVYVEAIGFIIVGHAQHHLDILKERYQ